MGPVGNAGIVIGTAGRVGNVGLASTVVVGLAVGRTMRVGVAVRLIERVQETDARNRITNASKMC
jgi:hypothetical protein